MIGEGLVGHRRRVRVEGTIDIDDLLRCPSAGWFALLVLSACADRQTFDGRARGARPVRAEREIPSAVEDAAHPILRGCPFLAEAGDREDGHEVIELCPQRLHVRDDPELGEASEICGIDDLGVGDHWAAIAGPVRDDRRFDGVEGLPHGGIADGVDVNLETRGVDGPHRLGEGLSLPHPQPVVVQRGAVGIEQ